MDQLRNVRPLPVSPDNASSTVWATVGHYLSHHRGHHVPLAALLRAPWRCLLNLAGGPSATGTTHATVRVLPTHAPAPSPVPRQAN